MKNLYKIAVLMCVTVFSAAHAYGQIGDVKIGDPVIDKNEETVTVRFRADVRENAVKRNHLLVFGPEFTDGTFRWSLPVIVVQGKGSKASLDRQILASGKEALFADAVFTTNGGTVVYSASAPYQEWMEGASLSVSAVGAGCCSASVPVSWILADNLRLQPEEEKEEPAVVPPELTTGDRLATEYSFVTAADDFEEVTPGGLYNEDRENSITIHFAQGKYDIIGDFKDNRRVLGDLMSSIRLLEESVDSDVTAVLVAGFASPEGSYEFNDRLAWNRAVSVKEYVMQHSALVPAQVKIYNGSTDWQGLRMLVERSDMPRKATVLDIIDNVPVWDPQKQIGRLGELMKLEGGEPYRYMLQNFFPKLRNAAYIRVYYRNK